MEEADCASSSSLGDGSDVLTGLMMNKDVFVYIFLRLIDVPSIGRISCVCRKWNAFSNDNSLWKQLCLRDFGYLIRVDEWDDWKDLYKSKHFSTAENNVDKSHVADELEWNQLFTMQWSPKRAPVRTTNQLELMIKANPRLLFQEYYWKKKKMTTALLNWMLHEDKSPRFIKWLIQRGADCNTFIAHDEQTKGGELKMYALEQAIQKNYFDTALLMLDNGAHKNYRLLLRSAEAHWLRGIEIALESGVDISHVNNKGQNALTLAKTRHLASYTKEYTKMLSLLGAPPTPPLPLPASLLPPKPPLPPPVSRETSFFRGAFGPLLSVLGRKSQ